MAITRRAAIAALVAAPAVTVQARQQPQPLPPAAMYGLIVKMRAKPGQRDLLLAILAEGTSGMPGCLSYVIAKDPADADALWITEAWVSAERHRASRDLPAVRAAVAKGRPLIAGMDHRFETQPVAGVGPGATSAA